MDGPLLQYFMDSICAQTGLCLRTQDGARLWDVVRDRLKILGLASPDDYLRFLEQDDQGRHELETLTILLTTGETYFFRDGGQFAMLRDKLLPELIKRRESTRVLRIWSAACSTGEEAYSLAMVLDELLDGTGQWNILLLGTDVNPEAIEKARRGIYTQWSFRNLDDARRTRYFTPRGNTWVLDERIRTQVRFSTGNLLMDRLPDYVTELHDIDLILCRNMFIYLTQESVAVIVDKLAETLAEGGYLLTGHGELYAHHLGKLRTRIFPESIVYQKVSAPIIPIEALVTPAQESRPVVMPAPVAVSTRPHQAPQAQPVLAPGPEEREMLQAWQYANEGQRERASGLCDTLIVRDPLAAEPYYLLALLSQERGDDDAARTLLKKVIYLAPTFVAAYLELGSIYDREGLAQQSGKMRATALALLKEMPADKPVKLYGATTAGEIRQFLERLLAPVGPL